MSSISLAVNDVIDPLPANTSPTLDLVMPVYNEEADLASSVPRLHAFLETFPFSCRITIADNASTDGTTSMAEELAAQLPAVCVLHLPAKGRGRSLRAAWTGSDAAVVAYMTSTCLLTWPDCCHSSRCSCPVTVTSPSAPGSRPHRASYAARNVSSSPAGTTPCCVHC
jgi:hypothetical protein